MGVDKEELSTRFTKTFKGHFLKSGVTSLSTFKAELLSHCSSTPVYDIQFSSFWLSTFIRCKKHNFKFCYIRPSGTCGLQSLWPPLGTTQNRAVQRSFQGPFLILFSWPPDLATPVYSFDCCLFYVQCLFVFFYSTSQKLYLFRLFSTL